MKRYKFSDGTVITSNLSKNELLKRMKRIDILRVLVEGNEEGPGYSIYLKAVKAFNKKDNWTGIIRLSRTEKDYLNYIFTENEHLSDEDKKVIAYYIRY